jgi:hypothetical protein
MALEQFRKVARAKTKLLTAKQKLPKSMKPTSKWLKPILTEGTFTALSLQPCQPYLDTF